MKKLYSDPLTAMVRELISNAHDARIAAGKPESSAHIQSPIAGLDQFVVSDEGTGIPPNEFVEIYTTFFRSTKQNTNDAIGGFGLGCKSPLAYTDSFTVENRYGGTCYTYLIFIDEQRIPQCTLIDERNTTSPNGLTVSVAIDAQDRIRARRAIHDIARWFPNTECNDPLPALKPYITTETLQIYKCRIRQSEESALYVSVGNVLYPLEPGLIPTYCKKYGRPALHHILSTVMRLDVGQIELAPNRETIIQNAHNDRVLSSALLAAMTDLRNMVLANANAEPNYITAIRNNYTAMRALHNCKLWDLSQKHAPTGHLFQLNYYTLDLPRNWTAQTITHIYKTNRIATREVRDISVLHTRDITAIVHPNTAPNLKARIAHAKATDNPLFYAQRNVMLIETDDSVEAVQEKLANLTTANATVIAWDTLPPPPPPPKQRSKHPVQMRFRDCTPAHNWVDVTTVPRFFWVTAEEASPDDYYRIQHLVNIKNPIVVIVPESKLRHAKNAANGTYVYDVYAANKHIFIERETVIRTLDTLRSAVDRDITRFTLHHETIPKQWPKRLKAAWEAVGEILKTPAHPNLYYTPQLLARLDITDIETDKRLTEEILPVLNDFKPILSSDMDWNSSTTILLLNLYDKHLQETRS